MSVSQPYVSVRGMSFSRGDRLIYNNMDVDFPRGKVTAIMGPSGTGKTPNPKGASKNGWFKIFRSGNNLDFKSLEMPSTGNVDSGKSFGDFLADSISKVNNLQQDKDIAIQRLASGESKNIHETLLAVEKADLAFKQMNQIRQKVIDAYREIMKMQVLGLTREWVSR